LCAACGVGRRAGIRRHSRSDGSRTNWNKTAICSAAVNCSGLWIGSRSRSDARLRASPHAVNPVPSQMAPRPASRCSARVRDSAPAWRPRPVRTRACFAATAPTARPTAASGLPRLKRAKVNVTFVDDTSPPNSPASGTRVVDGAAGHIAGEAQTGEEQHERPQFARSDQPVRVERPHGQERQHDDRHDREANRCAKRRVIQPGDEGMQACLLGQQQCRHGDDPARDLQAPHTRQKATTRAATSVVASTSWRLATR
jgi:hypothetical protein